MLKKIMSLLPLFGPICAIVIWNTQIFEGNQGLLAGVMIWVVWWWLFTKIPLHLTGIMGVCVAIYLGIEVEQVTLASFSNPMIFLFMGGFILAKAMEVNSLHQRIALLVINSKFINQEPQKVIVALLSLTCFLSMWISNTATVAIMLPISLGILSQLNLNKMQNQLLLIAIGYSATIGGLGTPIGSAPNALAMGMLSSISNINLNFFEWMKFSFPIMLASLGFLTWNLLKRLDISHLEKMDISYTRKQLSNLGKLTSKEKVVIFVIFLTILGWLLPSLGSLFFGAKSEISNWLDQKFPESIVVLSTCMLLFLFPLGEKKSALLWEEAATIDWGTLLLFGSGIALGKMMFVTGLAKVIGDSFFAYVPANSSVLFLLALIVFTITFTEFVSNTAASNLLIPIVIPMAANFNISPLIPVLATAMSCNLAFSLPISTPPNAIVYGTGLIDIKVMVKNGSLMNLVCTIFMFLYLAIFL